MILVGEIRDEETARVAVQAALTGHLVLATLHTNDAPGAVSRLIDMGVEPYLLSGALNGVVAQRLVRTVCPRCSEPYHPEPDTVQQAGLADPDHTFIRGTGCPNCHDSGFTGRMGIYEVMEMFPELRRLIQKGVSSHEIRDRWVEEGGVGIRQEAVIAAMSGRTSLEEALGATHGEGDALPGSVGRKLSGDPVAVEVG